MGVIFQEVRFAGSAPALAQIASKISEITGLKVAVNQSGANDLDSLYDVCGTLAFEGFDGGGVEVKAYRAGAVREHTRQMLSDADTAGNQWVEDQMLSGVQGAHEPAGTQTVYLRMYFGQDTTILHAALLALECLGGELLHPLDDEVRRQFSVPLSLDDLKDREMRRATDFFPVLWLGALLAPVSVFQATRQFFSGDELAALNQAAGEVHQKARMLGAAPKLSRWDFATSGLALIPMLLLACLASLAAIFILPLWGVYLYARLGAYKLRRHFTKNRLR